MMEETKQIQQIKKEEQKLEIFPTGKPAETIKFAKNVAKAVSDIVEKQGLFNTIQGKKYVRCEGWTTMGAILGLFPHIVEVKEEKTQKGVKYIATCEIRTLDGKLISRAESECASWERNKKEQEEYAIRSMAETRAVSKAFRICLSWVMTLAGYEPTPAEEITEEMIKKKEVIEVKNVEIPQPVNNTKPKKITDKQLKLLRVRLSQTDITEEEWKNYLRNNYGIQNSKDIKMEDFDKILQDIDEYKKKKQI